MRVIIAGAGEVGTHLAKMLSQENQDIVLMDPNEERLRFTDASLDIMPMVGSPTSPRDLDEAGIKKTDLFVSVMPEETSNITACMLAHNLGANKTLARINNYEYLLPRNKELLKGTIREAGYWRDDFHGDICSQRDCHSHTASVDTTILGAVRRNDYLDWC